MSASDRRIAGSPAPSWSCATALHDRGPRGDTVGILPLAQEQIAKALGITPVHANRIIRQLREAKIVDISRGRVVVLNEAKLAQLAQFDDRYLHQSPAL